MIILEENFKWLLEAFASELFIRNFATACQLVIRVLVDCLVNVVLEFGF